MDGHHMCKNNDHYFLRSTKWINKQTILMNLMIHHQQSLEMQQYFVFRTNTMFENNDHLFGRGTVGQKSKHEPATFGLLSRAFSPNPNPGSDKNWLSKYSVKMVAVHLTETWPWMKWWRFSWNFKPRLAV